MNEVATYQQYGAPAQQMNVQPPMMNGALSELAAQTKNSALSDLLLWAEAAQAVAGLSQGLANSLFVPKEFQGKPDNVTAAILRGTSLGLDPMQSVNSFDVIHGRPSMRARSMSAVVIGQGHMLKRTVATEQQVTYIAKRKGEDRWQEFTYTIERATREGLTSNPLYKTRPIAMLTAKAITEACRIVFPDIIEGISISEELESGEYEGAPMPEIGSTPEAPKKKVQRKPRAKKAPEPVAVAAAPAEEEPPTETEQTGELVSEQMASEIIKRAKAKWGAESPTMLDAELANFFQVEGLTLSQLTIEQGNAVLAELAK